MLGFFIKEPSAPDQLGLCLTFLYSLPPLVRSVPGALLDVAYIDPVMSKAVDLRRKVREGGEQLGNILLQGSRGFGAGVGDLAQW